MSERIFTREPYQAFIEDYDVMQGGPQAYKDARERLIGEAIAAGLTVYETYDIAACRTVFTFRREEIADKPSGHPLSLK